VLPLAAAATQSLSLTREVVSRIVGSPDFLASLAGARREKKLRVRILVVRGGDGQPVASVEQVETALGESLAVLAREAQTRVLPADRTLVALMEGPAPPEALDAPCSTNGLWRTDLGLGGSWFRANRFRAGYRFLGRGAPLTVFVVHDVVGKCGCSLGPFGDYITIDAEGLTGGTQRILAHEIGHSCGLPHTKRDGNLMRSRAPGEQMTRLQRAVFRSSRHVTYL